MINPVRVADMDKISNSYGQFCPVARAAEIITARWTPLLLRELLAGGTKFNELRNGVPLMSPSLLSKRLRELETAGIIRRERPAKGRGWDYFITDSGKELAPLIETLGIWGQKFILSEFENYELDPTLLMWDIQRRVDHDYFPKEGEFTACFTLRGAPRERKTWWIVINDRQVDLCVQDPGREVNLYVDAALKPLTDVWMGRLGIDQARRQKDVVLNGESRYVKSFAQWFLLSPFASYAGYTG